MGKEFGLDDYANLEGSLSFDNSGKDGDAPAMEIKMADISWIKRKKLDVPYAGESKNQVMDIYYPQEGAGPFAIMLHIHGGGFGMGDKRDDHMETYLKFLEKGIAVGSVEYRLSGEAIFPAAVLDCREAVRFLRKHAKEYNVLPNKIAVIGGSAGGNLSAMLGMNIPNGAFPGEEGKTFDTDCNVLFAIDQFGPVDFRNMDAQARANGVSFVDHDEATSAESSYMGGPLPELSDEWLDKANPMTYINENMAPLLVEHGCMDRLVPFMQSVNFVNAVYRKVGQGRVEFIPLPSADHEDKEYSSDWNMKALWSWIEKQL